MSYNLILVIKPDPCDLIETTTTTTTTPTPSPTIPPFQQTPGECLTKDNTPVEVDEYWDSSCKDNEGTTLNNRSNSYEQFSGNSYVEGSSLMSCCGCFK